VQYLRLSLTRGCQMRCTYCRPGRMHNDRGEELTAEEYRLLVAHLAERHGVRKVRLTGGDPTVRRDLIRIIESLAEIDALSDLAMTTNGLTLASTAHDYHAAGLRRVNISLDALDRERFRRITGVDGLDRVLAGIDAALNVGLTPVKVNTVVMRGVNEVDLDGLVRFASTRDVEIRFIELMPMGPLADRWAELYVSADQMQRRLDRCVRAWRRRPQGSDSATRYRATLDDGRKATIGFITPMSCNFCAACNRLRITADGSLYPCLMDRPAGSLMSAVRPRFDPDRLDQLIGRALPHKQDLHPVQGFATMTHIGG